MTMTQKTENPSSPSFGGDPSADTGRVGRAQSEWSFGDRLGAAMVRLGIRRMHYAVMPGLYTLGTPGPDSPVFVSANYKLSFDHLRRALAGTSAWILVLDTQGVNVWCAAAKGTFGTAELIRQVHASRLHEHVAHRRLILPQLAAPGIAAHEVSKQTGFRVIYGPVYAADIGVFLQAGLKATPAMRRVRFRWHERLAVASLELVNHFTKMMATGLALAVLADVSSSGISMPPTWNRGGITLLLWTVSFGLAGILGPLLLPWLPTRAFAIKGAGLGVMLALGGIWLVGGDWSVLRCIAWLFLLSAGASHLLLTFTGSTTFTSPSGVRREVRLALPVQIAAGAIGLVTWIAAGLVPKW